MKERIIQRLRSTSPTEIISIISIGFVAIFILSRIFDLFFAKFSTVVIEVFILISLVVLIIIFLLFLIPVLIPILKKAQPVATTIWIRLRWLLLAVLVFILLACLNVFFDAFGWIAGSNEHIHTVGPNEEYIPDKTLWDWMDLLIVPVALGIGAIWFNLTTQHIEQANQKYLQQREQSAADDRDRAAALRDYMDKITELLFKNDQQERQNMLPIARARTLIVLRSLARDKERKNDVLWFLVDSKLIAAKLELPPDSYDILSLSEADLTNATLRGAALTRVDFRKADLGGTILEEADLSEAKLTNANLSRAILTRAKLIRADLSEATLTGAKLTLADLKGANLSGATITEGQLSDAKSLEGATMPNGKPYDPNKPLWEQVIPLTDKPINVT